MKKKAILALTLAGLVALQMPMTAMADDPKHQHNGEDVTSEQGNQDVTGIGKTAVDVSGSTVNCSVGNVVAKSASATDRDSHNAIHAQKGATVTAYSAKNDSYNNDTIVAMDSGTTVTIKTQDGAAGDVTNSGEESAISATTKATVTAGSATNNGEGATVEVYHAATVTVDEAVTNNGNGNAIKAVNGSTVTAGSATNGVADQTGNYATIHAKEAGTTVIIEAKDGVEGATGDVTNKGGDNSAVWVESGATVVIEGTAKNNDAGEGTVCCDGGTVIVYKLENTANSSNLIDQDSSDASNIYYIIKGTDSEGIDLANTTGLTSQTVLAGTTYEKTYQTAKGEEEIKIAVESGYEVKAGTIEVTKNADGTYSIKVPVGGGVTLETIKEAVEKAKEQQGEETTQTVQVEAEEKKATVTGSEGSAVIGGQWNVAPDGTWTYRNNGIFKDTWGYITLANGKTGWFYFDKNGVMATGWKQINGKWYYFNEVNDGTQGMMLVNTTTPDGNKVGADGAWIQ